MSIARETTNIYMIYESTAENDLSINSLCHLTSSAPEVSYCSVCVWQHGTEIDGLVLYYLASKEQ